MVFENNIFALYYLAGVVLNVLLIYIMFTYSKNRLNPSTMIILSILFPVLSFVGTALMLLVFLYNKFKTSSVNQQISKFSFHRKNSYLILITGKKGSGKSFIATVISNIVVPLGFTVARISFATPLKQILLRYYGIKKEDPSRAIKVNVTHIVDIDKGTELFIKENPFNLEPEELKKFEEVVPNLISKYYANKITNRELMQQLGDFFRNNISQDFFVDIAKEHISKLKKYVDIIIIDDLRFMNEDIRNQIDIPSIVIKVVSKENTNETDTHESENELESIHSDFVLMNDKTKDTISKPIESILNLTVFPNLIKE